MPSAPVINPVGNFTTNNSVTLNAIQIDNDAIISRRSVDGIMLEFFIPNAKAGISEQSPASVNCGSNCSIEVNISYLAERSEGISICVTGNISAFFSTGVDAETLTLINGGFSISSSPNIVFNGGQFNDRYNG